MEPETTLEPGVSLALQTRHPVLGPGQKVQKMLKILMPAP